MNQTVKTGDCCSVNKNGDDSYDLIVIGAGSAGFSASISAAEAGSRVAMVGHGTIGGTCVNVGCVPKKIMVQAAEYGQWAADAAAFGWDIEKRGHDWSVLKEARDKEVFAATSGALISNGFSPHEKKVRRQPNFEAWGAQTEGLEGL